MSFIQVNQDSHFPIQNLPYGIFSTQSNVSLRNLKKILKLFKNIFTAKTKARSCYWRFHFRFIRNKTSI